jgi:hypothetical protein
MKRGDQAAFPVPSDYLARGMTLREYCEIQIFAAMPDGVTPEEAIRATDRLLRAQERREEILQKADSPTPE